MDTSIARRKDGKLDKQFVKYKIYNFDSLLPYPLTFDCGGSCKEEIEPKNIPLRKMTHQDRNQKPINTFLPIASSGGYWSLIYSEWANFYHKNDGKQRNTIIDELVFKIKKKIGNKKMRKPKKKKKVEQDTKKDSPKQLTFDFGE